MDVRFAQISIRGRW